MDKAHVLTDIKLDQMELHISAIYHRASRELEEKFNNYFKRFADLDNKKRALVASGKMTPESYQAWRQGKILTGNHWANMKNYALEQFLKADQTAIAYVNDQLPEIYSISYNAVSNGIDKAVKGYSFELVDASTVKNLATTNKTLLPYKVVNAKKVERWNTEKINSEVLQGIIQGESIPQIAKRFRKVTEMDRKSAIRNARTTVTSAENKGRMDSYERAESMGIHMQKEWLATNDARTRDAHRYLDGKKADVKKPFKSPLGDIMYPGDPSAHPANVYNCRCTLISSIISINGKKVDDPITIVPDPVDPNSQPPQSQHKIQRDYTGNIASKIGSDKYDRYIDQLDDCPYEEVKTAYEQCLDKIQVGNTGKGQGSCSGFTINFDISQDITGTQLREKGQIFFHESGHAVDHIIGSKKGGVYYSRSWNNGEFSRTIHDEVDGWVSSVDKMLKSEFDSHKSDVGWLRSNGYLFSYNESVLTSYAQRNGGTLEDLLSGKIDADKYIKQYFPKYSKSYAYAYIEKEIKAERKTDPDWNYKYSDLSDILEGATKGKIQCGWGHGKAYWNKFDVSVEAFAELSQIHVSGAKSLKTVEKYLPKTVETYRRMIKDAIGV